MKKKGGKRKEKTSLKRLTTPRKITVKTKSQTEKYAKIKYKYKWDVTQTVPFSKGQAVTHLLWEFLLLLTWPRPVQPGVGHFRTFSYIARTSYRQKIGAGRQGRVRSPARQHMSCISV